MPTLIVWGEDDPVIPVAHAYEAHEAMPGSRLEVLPGCGHFPHCEDPRKFAAILLDFIATTTPVSLCAEDLAAAI
jgi:pimeloyl-ACP methyl ester carboxylesterase